MNTILESLHSRKSVRVFIDREISPKEKQQILTAATQAPTAGNQQMYTILDITDRRLKEILAETCDHQPFIAKAKMVLIFCADYQKWYDAFSFFGCSPRKPAAGEFLLAVQDAAIAAPKCSDCCRKSGNWLLLHRRYYGTLRKAPGTSKSAALCFSCNYGGLRLPHTAAGRPPKAQKSAAGFHCTGKPVITEQTKQH